MLQLTEFGGRGPKAYFIHGFGSDAQSWIANVPAITGSVQAIGIDLPAHGLSADIPVPDTLEQIALQVLDSIEATEPCFLIGHSAGGAIAMLCAARLPVIALNLISPVGLGAQVNRPFIEQLIAVQSEDEGLRLLQTMVANKRLVSKIAVRRLLSQLQCAGGREKWQRFAQVLFASQQGLATAAEELVRLNIPTEIHWGRDDTINPLSETDVRDGPGNWHLYDDCGHLPHIEHWSAYNDALIQFAQIRS